MRKAALYIMAMVLAGAGLAIGWFAGRYEITNSEQKLTPRELTTFPKFSSDGGAAKAIEALGYDVAYLYRWQSSHVDGWVEFDGEGGPNRFTFDTRQAKHPTEKPGELLDPKRLSGFVVVAMRKLPSAEWEEYEVKVEQRFGYDMSSDVKAIYIGVSQVGRVKTRPKTTDSFGRGNRLGRFEEARRREYDKLV